ncbi:hypothetical protein [Streptomonospora wellingtoniae]|uniref:Uncharacterized protein n=1 Tax=Streptomonospora wellingtoniae TaxID=3075544 RepID=A0ABU2KWM2_9ACTN|nr:hypothetical protein [Streptomonospora sp. DSM 45055]MDT0303696.1 hypothetical protein [Streptomonospora sp. DSM 45055]
MELTAGTSRGNPGAGGFAQWLARFAAQRPLLVTAVGGTGCRLAVERVMRERGLRGALAPSEADTLLECGPPGTAADGAAERVWDQMGEPRARVRVRAADEAADRIDEARAALLDLPAQRRAARRRLGADRAEAHADQHDQHERCQGDQHAPGGHGGHGGGKLPGGMEMADRGDDRDGLKLDRLHIAVGPAQSDWPAGLVAELTVQGDVVQEARLHTHAHAPGGAAVFWDHTAREVLDPAAVRFRAAAAADSLQRFLAVAGWPSAAATGRLLRDHLLAPEEVVTGRLRFTRWLRRVRSSRTLRWSVRGLGRAPDRLPDAPSGSLPAVGGDGGVHPASGFLTRGSPLPTRLRGDVAERIRHWFDDIAAVVMPDTSDTFLAPPIQREPGGPPSGGPLSAPPLPPLGRERADCALAATAVLPGMLVGVDLAAARLVVASFDPDMEALAAYGGETGHG